MSLYSRLFPRLDTPSDQPFQLKKFLAVLVISTGALALTGCGGEGPDDASSSPVAANSLTSATDASAGANVADSGQISNETTTVAQNDAGSPTQSNGQPYNRAVVQRAGQGD